MKRLFLAAAILLCASVLQAGWPYGYGYGNAYGGWYPSQYSYGTAVRSGNVSTFSSYSSAPYYYGFGNYYPPAPYLYRSSGFAPYYGGGYSTGWGWGW